MFVCILQLTTRYSFLEKNFWTFSKVEISGKKIIFELLIPLKLNEPDEFLDQEVLIEA